MKACISQLLHCSHCGTSVWYKCWIKPNFSLVQWKRWCLFCAFMFLISSHNTFILIMCRHYVVNVLCRQWRSSVKFNGTTFFSPVLNTMQNKYIIYIMKDWKKTKIICSSWKGLVKVNLIWLVRKFCLPHNRSLAWLYKVYLKGVQYTETINFILKH